MIYYVSANYKYIGNGTKEKPFQTITEAAQIAIAGDIVKILSAASVSKVFLPKE